MNQFNQIIEKYVVKKIYAPRLKFSDEFIHVFIKEIDALTANKVSFERIQKAISFLLDEVRQTGK